MPTGVRDVLLGVAIAVAIASLAYSIADHIETEKHVTQLEDIVIGDTSKPVGQGGGLIDMFARVGADTATAQSTANDAGAKVDALSSKASANFEILFLGLCAHLAGHTQYDVSPIYPNLDEEKCKAAMR